MNAGTALKASSILKKHFNFPLSSSRSMEGLKCRNWKGRMESFHQGGRHFILDGAHNPLSVRELIKTLKTGEKKEAIPWLIFGAMQDKNSREMLKIASRFFSKVILTGIAGSRAKPVALLLEEAKGLFKCVLTAQNIKEALKLMKQAAEPGAQAVVAGSFYLVGEARRILSHG